MSCHVIFFFFNDTATTEIYTLSLHDALPISEVAQHHRGVRPGQGPRQVDDENAVEWSGHPVLRSVTASRARRSEEHTSELQSRQYLVCRLLLEKKKQKSPKQQHLDCTTTDPP